LNEKYDVTISSSIIEIILYYLRDVLEIFVTIFIIRLVMKTAGKMENFNLEEIIKMSGLIGVITLVIELISPDWNTNIKQGISYTAGSALIII
jgi:hypothetical protein